MLNVFFSSNFLYISTQKASLIPLFLHISASAPGLSKQQPLVSSKQMTNENCTCQGYRAVNHKLFLACFINSSYQLDFKTQFMVHRLCSTLIKLDVCRFVKTLLFISSVSVYCLLSTVDIVDMNLEICWRIQTTNPKYWAVILTRQGELS